MINKTAKNINESRPENNSVQSADRIMIIIERYSILTLFLLIFALLFLSYGLKLITGFMIIASACLGLIIVRKTKALNLKYKDLLNQVNSFREP